MQSGLKTKKENSCTILFPENILQYYYVIYYESFTYGFKCLLLMYFLYQSFYVFYPFQIINKFIFPTAMRIEIIPLTEGCKTFFCQRVYSIIHLWFSERIHNLRSHHYLQERSSSLPCVTCLVALLY